MSGPASATTARRADQQRVGSGSVTTGLGSASVLTQKLLCSRIAASPGSGRPSWSTRTASDPHSCGAERLAVRIAAAGRSAGVPGLPSSSHDDDQPSNRASRSSAVPHSMSQSPTCAKRSESGTLIKQGSQPLARGCCRTCAPRVGTAIHAGPVGRPAGFPAHAPVHAPAPPTPRSTPERFRPTSPAPPRAAAAARSPTRQTGAEQHLRPPIR